MNQKKLEKQEADAIMAFRKNFRISDDQSTGENPSYTLGKWAYETGCDCSTCQILKA